MSPINNQAIIILCISSAFILTYAYTKLLLLKLKKNSQAEWKPWQESGRVLRIGRYSDEPQNPGQLSGGQRQQVAVGRALIIALKYYY